MIHIEENITLAPDILYFNHVAVGEVKKKHIIGGNRTKYLHFN